MSRSDGDPVTIAVRIEDGDLEERIAAALATVDGVRLVGNDDPADLILEPSGADLPSDAAPLTRREREVIALLAEGLSNKRIAQRLGIAPDTAKFHVGRLLDKLDATGRTDAVALAARLWIIEL